MQHSSAAMKIAMALVLVGAKPALQETPPTQTRIFTVSQPESHFNVRHINNMGECVGYFGVTDNPVTPGVMTVAGQKILGNAVHKNQIALDINDSGTILLQDVSTGRMTSFLLANGKKLRIPSLGGRSCVGNKINSEGWVVGEAETKRGYMHAFLYSNARTRDLGTLGGSQSEARACNDTGEVVGWSGTGTDKALHAFLWRDGRMTDLGTLGGPASMATSINNAGDAVGFSDTRESAPEQRLPVQHACIWRRGVIADIQTAPSFRSRANAINNHQVVVGSMELLLGIPPQLETHAFMWRNGTMTDLNDLMGHRDGWLLTSAADINDNGQIVGYGNKGVFLLNLGPDMVSVK